MKTIIKVIINKNRLYRYWTITPSQWYDIIQLSSWMFTGGIFSVIWYHSIIIMDVYGRHIFCDMISFNYHHGCLREAYFLWYDIILLSQWMFMEGIFSVTWYHSIIIMDVYGRHIFCPWMWVLPPTILNKCQFLMPSGLLRFCFIYLYSPPSHISYIKVICTHHQVTSLT